MLRLSKMTDYGAVALAYMASRPDAVHAAAEVAEATRINLPTVSKLLKQLTRSGLLVSQRGANGGYVFARRPEEITAADIIDAIEGDVGITECSVNHGQCDMESHCNVGSAWQQINSAIREALARVTLAELAQPATLTPPKLRLGQRVIPIKPEF